MLTLPILIALFITGLVTSAWGVYKYVKSRRWRWLVFSYYMLGFWGLAMPLKIALHATSMFAMLYLSTIWPIWLGQGVFGYSLLAHTPMWFIALLFNF
jgi:hypothetical protein